MVIRYVNRLADGRGRSCTSNKMIAKHRVDHIVLLTDLATTGTNAQFRVYLGCQRNIPGTVRTIAYISLQIWRETVLEKTARRFGWKPTSSSFLCQITCTYSLTDSQYFRLFGCCWISRLVLILGPPNLPTTYLTYSSINYMYLV